MEQRMTSEECEAAFQEIVRKLPSVADPRKLEELSLLGIALMLRRTESAGLKAELSQRVHAAVAKAHNTEQIHAAAHECVQAVIEAKRRRLPRAHHTPPVDEDKSVSLWVNVGLAVMLAVVGAAVWWGTSRTGDGPSMSDSAQFVEQMVAAAKGGGPATHMFGGPLSLSSMNGATVVVAERVPPGICAAAGMRLVKLGTIGVNGLTPSRVSSAVLTELCNKEPGGATLQWAPDQP